MGRLLTRTLVACLGITAGVHIALYMLVERVSFAAGFRAAAGGALLGLAVFVLAERRVAGRSVLPRPAAGV